MSKFQDGLVDLDAHLEPLLNKSKMERESSGLLGGGQKIDRDSGPAGADHPTNIIIE
jgi:hypothetical protein